MKKTFLLIMATLLLSVSAFADPIIIDHTAVREFDLHHNDPEFQAAVEQAKQMFHIAYGHTSHGSQIISGLNGLDSFMVNKGAPKGLYTVNNGGTNGALDLEEGNGYGNGWLDHDVGYSGWVEETEGYLDGVDDTGLTADHSDVNVLMWSWCGQVDAVNIQSHYLTNMVNLESKYPDVAFIYMTGHLEGATTGSSWFDNNNAIREHVANSNNAILFDFADIEKYDPDQLVNYADYGATDGCDSREGNWAREWQSSHTLNEDWYSVSCSHSQPLNCNQKAKAFWVMMARMAGWAPTPVNDGWCNLALANNADPCVSVEFSSSAEVVCDTLVGIEASYGEQNLTILKSSVTEEPASVCEDVDSIEDILPSSNAPFFSTFATIVAIAGCVVLIVRRK